MGSSFRHPLFIPFLLIILLYSICWTAQAYSNTLQLKSCNHKSKVSPGSQVAANIRRLVSELVSKAAVNGFAATMYGNNNAAAAKECPNMADIRIWYDYCTIRYSLENIIGKIDTDFGISDSTKQNVTDPEAFNKTLGGLFTKIESQALMPGNHKFLGTGQVKLSKSTTLYALVQCAEDLSPENCAGCLKFAVAFLPELCGNHTGCYWSCSTCLARYNLKKFFFPLNSTIILSY
ncbi:hypothetical protein SAY86_009881 [Trapa natans]|uniref:Gnk2-homologous domain-containing protein n=1 Tax=Trapa natans TaxID=22666 RepID=A0AAN7QRK6_TRANT|nr:hypothetical protein SAY86_009881 [Trapa natans]